MHTEVSDLLSAVAASIASDASGLSETAVERITRDIPVLGGDPIVVDLLRSSADENVVKALKVFQLQSDAATVEVPAAATDYARRLAQRGVPISALLRAYRVSHSLFQERMIRGISSLATDPAVVGAASIAMSTTMFVLVDRASERVEVAYEQERDTWMRNQVAVRWARVTSLLGSNSVDVDDAETTLGYAMRQAHLGAVVWSESGSDVPDPLSRLERVVRRLAEYLGCRKAPLFVASDESTVWAWLPQPRVPIVMDFAGLRVGEGVSVALGQVASGVDGFRLTHRQALQAHAVALAARAKDRATVTTSAQVGPIAMMCADIGALRVWVQGVLGDLAIDDQDNRRLRETLWDFLSAQGSYTAVAERSALHRNTVRYRVRKAEELLGHGLESGRLDIEVALLACRWLGTTVLRPPVRRSRRR
jgi:hypothetical protein